MKTEKQKYCQKTMAALNITICPNGDQYIRKKLVLNRKRIPNLEVLLDNATQLIGARNCVRLLRTPNHGTRVTNLDKMVDGGVYVAIAGPSDKLKRIQYTGTSKHPPKPLNSDGPRRRARVTVQSRAFSEGLAEASRYRMIYVYRNGEDSGMRMLLDKRLLFSIDKVLQHISDKLRMNTAVRCIYDVDGHLVDEVSKIQNNATYVAVGFGQRFKRSSYNKQDTHLITPRRPAASKFSGSTDSSVHKKKIKQERTTTHENAKVKRNAVNTSYDVNTSPEKENLFDKLNAVVDKQVDEIDDVIDDKLTSHVDDDVEKMSPRGNEVTKRMSITPDRMTSPVQHENEAMIISPPISPRRSPTPPTTKRENTHDIKPTELLDRDGTFDKEETLHNEPDSPVAEPQKKAKKKSKAFGSTFDKALSKSERANSLDSDNADKQQQRRRSSVKEEIKNDKTAPKKSEKPAKPAKKSRKKSKIETQQSIQDDSLNVKDSTFVNEENAIETPVEENVSKDDLTGTPPREPSPEEPTPRRPLKDEGIKTETDVNEGNDDIVEEIGEDTTDRKSSIKSNSDSRKGSPTVFQASGEQSEIADEIRDNKETKVEKTIDMVPAEIIEDEEIEVEEDEVEEVPDDKNQNQNENDVKSNEDDVAKEKTITKKVNSGESSQRE